MEWYKIDHVKTVTKEVAHQVETLWLGDLDQFKKNVTELYQTILESLTPTQLSAKIKEQFKNKNGTWKSIDEIKNHPSCCLVVQLCLDMLWYHSTNVTWLYDDWTKKWINEFEQRYGMKIDSIISVWFLEQCTTIFDRTTVPLRYSLWVSMAADATATRPSQLSTLPETIDTLQHTNVSKRFDQILWNTPYSSIKSQFIDFVDDIPSIID